MNSPILSRTCAKPLPGAAERCSLVTQLFVSLVLVDSPNWPANLKLRFWHVANSFAASYGGALNGMRRLQGC